MIPIQFPQAIDSTMLTCFDECPTKFYTEFVLRRVPIGRSIDLHCGGCMASAFDRIRTSFYKDRLELEEALHLAFPHFVREWGTIEPPEGNYKDFVNSWGAIEQYFREYPPGQDYFQPLWKEDGYPATEFRFAIPMGINHPDTGNPILFAGRADLLSQPVNSDEVYVVDEKTTKAMGPKWAEQWPMRGQFYGYTFAARHHGYNCVGALVRGICLQQTQYKFEEYPLLLSDWQLERWWIEAHRKASQMVQYYEMCKEAEDYPARQLAWPMSFGHGCENYGGCAFSNLCLSRRPWEIYETYETRVWNPLAQDPTEESEDRLSQMETISLEDAMR